MIARHALVVLVALAAACDGPRVGTSSQQLVNTNPSSWDFGAVPVGGSATPRTVTVSVGFVQNEWHQIESITESCGDFSLDLSEIPGFPAEIYRYCDTCTPPCQPEQFAICEAQTQRFSVGFTPTVAGPQACTITVQLNDEVKYVTMMGTGIAPNFDLTVLEPTDRSLAFGDVLVGTASADVPIVVRNDGVMPLDIYSVTLISGDMGVFDTHGAGPSTLSPGETRELLVHCAPAAAGPLSGTLEITSADPAEPSVLIELSCNGIESNLVINPSPARMPDTFLGDTTSTTITLINTGTASMSLDDVSVSPGQFAVTAVSDVVLAANGGAADVTLEFTADESVIDQDVQGILSVLYDGGEVRTIDVVGPSRTAILSVTPGGEVDFGTVCGGQSASRVFAAINLGSGEFELVDAAVGGDGFALSLAPPLPAELPARGGATAAFELTAAPPTGPATGTFTLTPDVPNLPPTTVTLLANGQLDGVAAWPPDLVFEAVFVDEPSGGKAVRLNNCDPTSLMVTGARITGPHADDFTAVTELAVPGSIPPYGGATWLVELTPSGPGDRTATLELEHALGTTSVPLAGLGVDEAAEGRGSYYACASSDARTLSPLVLALALLLRPRRRRRARQFAVTHTV